MWDPFEMASSFVLNHLVLLCLQNKSGSQAWLWVQDLKTPNTSSIYVAANYTNWHRRVTGSSVGAIALFIPAGSSYVVIGITFALLWRPHLTIVWCAGAPSENCRKCTVLMDSSSMLQSNRSDMGISEHWKTVIGIYLITFGKWIADS